MTRDGIIDSYFEWLFDLACKNRYAKDISYRKLLMHLHDIPFRYSIPRDKNRAADGADLRYRFALKFTDENYILECLDGPCSVLEMMLALAIRCEETIMDNTSMGDRTQQWFWGMVTNLGLGSMSDRYYDRRIVDGVIDRFLDREYEPDGRGGLFYIRHCEYDLRDVEIWYQLNWYLNSILDI